MVNSSEEEQHVSNLLSFMKVYKICPYCLLFSSGKLLLRFSRGFTQSQFNSTINKFIYTSKHSVQ